MSDKSDPTLDEVTAELHKVQAELARAIENMDGPSAKVLDELAKLKAENEWHLASDRPDDSRFCLILNEYGIVRESFYHGATHLFDLECTHWRNLPKGPASV